MRRDIVKLIESENDLTSVIVLTHNIDFVYIQAVLLPALRRCGHPTLTIFADAQCARETYENQHLVLDTLGHRFRVVPVPMQPGFRFHPKAILLSGQSKGTLLVGSGNLTFGGWRENAEIWCRFDTDTDGTAPFAAFRSYLHAVLSQVPLQEILATEIEECFEGGSRSWAVNMEAPDRLLGSPGTGTALIDQMKGVIGERTVQRLLLCAPYFDDTGEALTALSKTFDTTVRVAVQGKHTGLRTEAAQGLGSRFDLAPVTFHHVDNDDKSREAFIHAKWYGFEHDDHVTVFMGSANCSRAALTIPGNGGNAELMAVASLPKDKFVSEFLSELEFIDAPLQLSASTGDEVQPETGLPSIHIMAARLDEGVLQIAYHCTASVKLEGMVIYTPVSGSTPTPYSEIETGVIVACNVSGDCHQVRLHGRTGQQKIVSNLMWIDHEQALSSTARSRSVVDAVRKKVQSQDWNIGAWSEIANVFFRNLQYMPVRPTHHQRSMGGRENAEGAQQTFTADDVFSDSYGLPAFDRHFTHPFKGDERITSLRQLMLRWFGLKEDTAPGEGPVDPKEPGTDEPEVPFAPPKVSSHPIRSVTETDRKRAVHMLQIICDAMSSPDYLSVRPPETLSADIQFASVLLREGLHESWITEAEYFAVTQKIWSALFFSCPRNASVGWLEYRYRTEGDPEAFVSRMVSPKLTAALAAWALAVPDGPYSPEHVRFRLSQVLSVARLPWLWELAPRDELSKELKELLRLTTSPAAETHWTGIECKWRSLMQQGHALRVVERAVGTMTPAKIKDYIPQVAVVKGELLWQGTAGFCIATQDFTRSPQGGKVGILYLQQAREGSILAEFAVPLKGLVESELLALPEKPKAVLAGMNYSHM